MQSIRLADIRVGERLRKDYGELTDLDSITTVGLIQPIVLVQEASGRHALVAGGRRFNKLIELGYEEVYHGTTCDPQKPGFVYREELSPDVQREVELYENICRKQMTWTERVRSIAEIHRLKKHRAALDSETWGQAETGREIGQERSYVSYCLTVDEELNDPNSPLWKATGLTEALRMLVERRESVAKRQNAELTSKVLPVGVNDSQALEQQTTDGSKPPPLVVPLSKMLFNGDCTTVMSSFDPESVDHIISDWPYAIDMDYLDQGNGMNVDRVRAEHDVTDNLRNYPLWLAAMFRVLKPGGFCVLWYDNIHFDLIRKLAETIGYRVQRWPLVWIKTSPCLNQMANKNFTKATEFAVVLSKGNALLQKIQATNYWSGPRASNTSNPFAKPKELWQWIYNALCLKGDVVLDPFAGEGSATLAAIDFGLRPLAIESNADHFGALDLNVRNIYNELTDSNVNYQ